MNWFDGDSSPLTGYRSASSRWLPGLNMSHSDPMRRLLGPCSPPGTGSDTMCLVKPRMRCEERRLHSFRGWRDCHTQISHTELARAGFYYLGPGDRVQCFCCGGVLRSWEPGDRPGAEHRKFFPTCPFVLGREVGNVPRAGGRDLVDGQILGHRVPGEDDEPSLPLYPEMDEERERLATYRAWPHYAEVTPEQLARAGFFYTGHGDNVKCFYCDGGLRNWERDDDPWREHAKWFPQCEFLLQSMGQAYVRSVQENHFSSPETTPEFRPSFDRRPPSTSDSPGFLHSVLQSTVAQGALQMGFEQNMVASVMHSKFLLTGAPYSSVCDLVTDLVHAEDEERATHSRAPVRFTGAPAPRGDGTEPQRPKDPELPLSTEEQLRRLKEERICKVCMDRDVSIVFIPCGHLVVCTDCAPNLRYCPICRAAIRGSVRAFMS
ncbi:baculoviral IAP repeat-containing protein 7 [Ascaphus truei]|uniref:baculoviral IAP repeat-containing protein 7 n=1 Tax=Ascaphus truei TaxID=8439 RepID=UPI003F59C3A4